MDNYGKFLRLLFLMMGVIFGSILSIVLIVLIFRSVSIALFSNHGSQSILHYFIIILPYLIYFVAYFYLDKKIRQTKNKTPKIVAAIFLISGCVICLTSLITSTAVFLGGDNSWLLMLDGYSGFGLAIQLVIVFLTITSIAVGSPKEKDWLENNS